MRAGILYGFFFHRAVIFQSNIPLSDFEASFNRDFNRIHDLNGSGYKYKLEREGDFLSIEPIVVKNRGHMYPRLDIRLLKENKNGCNVEVKFKQGVVSGMVLVFAMILLALILLLIAIKPVYANLFALHQVFTIEHLREYCLQWFGIIVTPFIFSIVSFAGDARECLRIRATTEEVFQLMREGKPKYSLSKLNSLEAMRTIDFDNLPDKMEVMPCFRLIGGRSAGIGHLYLIGGLFSGMILANLLPKGWVGVRMLLLSVALLVSYAIFYHRNLRTPLFILSSKGFWSKKLGLVKWADVKSIKVDPASNTVNVTGVFTTDKFEEDKIRQYNKYEMVAVINHYKARYGLERQ